MGHPAIWETMPRIQAPAGFSPAYGEEMQRYFAGCPRHALEEEERTEWVEVPDRFGEYAFTLDGVRFFNLFHDFPWALTDTESDIFVEDQPYWAEFFRGRLHPNADDRTRRVWVGGCAPLGRRVYIHAAEIVTHGSEDPTTKSVIEDDGRGDHGPGPSVAVDPAPEPPDGLEVQAVGPRMPLPLGVPVVPRHVLVS